MTDLSSALSVEEYRALRATIRERGTARMAIAVATFALWAAGSLVVQSIALLPVAALFPLVVLATGFEAVFAIHVGVERIGRYLQVYYETVPGLTPMWERLAMEPNPTPSTTSRVDPLFAALFIGAAILNLTPVVLLSLDSPNGWAGLPVELVVFGLFHLIFLGRVLHARRFASSQRVRDLAFFTDRRAH